MPHCNWLSAFITAVLFPLVDAFYYVDDNNSSITYGAGSIYTGVGSTTAVSPWVSYPPTPIANWFGWSVDPEKTFGGTYHYFNWPEYPQYQDRSKIWTMDIPFTGSGITFYVFSFSEVNVSIDGDLPRNIKKDCDPTDMCYNTSLFDIQGLYTDKPHNLHVVCLDIQLFFDYVKVNDTVLLPPSPAVSSQTSPTTGGSQTTAGRSKSNIGAIVGGTVGGLVVIAVILFLLLRMRSRKKSTTTEMYAGPLALTGEVSSLPVAMDRTMPRHLTEPSMSPTLANLDPTISKTASGTNLPSPSSISTPISAIPNEYTSPQTTALPPQSIGEISQPPVLSGPNAASNPLTDEQTEFVHNLYNLSVPAPAIASVMNRMIRENESGGRSNGGVTTTPPMDQRPPEYDFKAGEGD